MLLGNIYTFHPYEDVFLKDLTDKNDKINYLKLKFIDDEKVKSLLCSNNYKHIELSPDGSMLLLYSTTKIGYPSTYYYPPLLTHALTYLYSLTYTHSPILTHLYLLTYTHSPILTHLYLLTTLLDL